MNSLIKYLLIGSLAATSAFANLIQDPSFESGLRPWFAERSMMGVNLYSIGFLKSKEATDGDYVLNVEGWSANDINRILSPELPLKGGTYNASIKARVVGANPATVELGIYNARAGIWAVFAKETLQPDSQWVTLSGTTTLPEGTESGHFAMVVAGDSHHTRLELDEAGLFEGESPGKTTNNVEVFTWPEEHVIAKTEAVTTATITRPGKYTLWVHCSTGAANELEIALRQKKTVLASRILEEQGPTAPPYSVEADWVSISADLKAGPVEVVLRNPSGNAPGRRIDFLLLTNYTDYIPQTEDFRQGFLRFTNHSKDPYCLYLWGFRHYGILSRPGFYPGSTGAPINYKDLWIGPGESTPWVRITEGMPKRSLPVSILATIGNREGGDQEGYPGRFVGTLEFAYGVDHAITKRIPIDQSSPLLLLTVPYDFRDAAGFIITGAPVRGSVPFVGSRLDQATHMPRPLKKD